MKTAHQMCGSLCIYGRQVICLSNGGGGRLEYPDHKIKRGWLRINQWSKSDQSFCDSSSSRMIFSSISSAITSLARSSLCSTTSVNIPMVLPSNSNALTLLASESASLDSFINLSRTYVFVRMPDATEPSSRLLISLCTLVEILGSASSLDDSASTHLGILPDFVRVTS